MADNEQDVQVPGNMVEIRTMTDEEYVSHWAAQNKISSEATEKLFKEGFTSMEALKLIDSEDLGKTKIPRGQQKLILAAVARLSEKSADHTEQHVRNNANDVTTEETCFPSTSAAAAAQSLRSSQSNATGNRNQNGGALGGKQTAATTVNDSFNVLLNNLQTGQTVIRDTITDTQSGCASGQLDNPVNNGLSVSQSLNQSSVASVNSHSWRDPQIFLESAAQSKSAPTHLDITDFISGTIEEEIIVGGNGTQQVVVKSGPRKPKLENVTLAQWSVANLAILYKLVGESKLHAGNILDYLSYTTKVCQLVQRYTLVSVLMYDREYRQLQARHGFRWGTDVPHFHTIHLQPRPSRSAQPQSGKNNGATTKGGNSTTPLTLDGKIICKLYNSKAGCHYKECRFAHQCSHAGCHQYHSAQTHHQAKNL